MQAAQASTSQPSHPKAAVKAPHSAATAAFNKNRFLVQISVHIQTLHSLCAKPAATSPRLTHTAYRVRRRPWLTGPMEIRCSFFAASAFSSFSAPESACPGASPYTPTALGQPAYWLVQALAGSCGAGLEVAMVVAARRVAAFGPSRPAGRRWPPPALPSFSSRQVAKVQIVHVVRGSGRVQLHADVPAPLPSLIAVVGHAASTDNLPVIRLFFVIRHAYIGRVQPDQIHTAVPNFAPPRVYPLTAVGVAQLGAPRKMPCISALLSAQCVGNFHRLSAVFCTARPNR